VLAFSINQSFNIDFQIFSDDIRFLNHMMEKHGFRNPNIDKPDRNSRGY